MFDLRKSVLYESIYIFIFWDTLLTLKALGAIVLFCTKDKV